MSHAPAGSGRGGRHAPPRPAAFALIAVWPAAVAVSWLLLVLGASLEGESAVRLHRALAYWTGVPALVWMAAGLRWRRWPAGAAFLYVHAATAALIAIERAATALWTPIPVDWAADLVLILAAPYFFGVLTAGLLPPLLPLGGCLLLAWRSLGSGPGEKSGAGGRRLHRIGFLALATLWQAVASYAAWLLMHA